MTTTPKRHHVVPKFFLQRFALDDKIELVDRHDLSTRITTNVEKALAYKHFYSVHTEDGRDTTVERMFATHIEGPAKRAISRLVDEKRSCSLPGLRGPFATFLAFQYVRGPGFRFASVEFFKAIGQKTALLMTPDMARRELSKVKALSPPTTKLKGSWRSHTTRLNTALVSRAKRTSILGMRCRQPKRSSPTSLEGVGSYLNLTSLC
jgi:hypothetical protein